MLSDQGLVVLLAPPLWSSTPEVGPRPAQRTCLLLGLRSVHPSLFWGQSRLTGTGKQVKPVPSWPARLLPSPQMPQVPAVTLTHDQRPAAIKPHYGLLDPPLLGSTKPRNRKRTSPTHTPPLPCLRIPEIPPGPPRRISFAHRTSLCHQIPQRQGGGRKWASWEGGLSH